MDSGSHIHNLGVEAVDVNGAGTGIAGLVARVGGGRIAMSYSTGLVTGNYDVGGLVGRNDGGSITASYSTASVSGIEHVGGLMARNYEGRIANCYSNGTATGQIVGGLVGLNGGGSITSCYTTATDFIVNEYHSGSSTSSLFEGENCDICTTLQLGLCLTTAEMQTATTFLDVGWDFINETDNGTDDIWWILEGQDYPRLWWEEPDGEQASVQDFEQ